MELRPFKQNDLTLVSDALDIAEDATGNFFKFSLGQWKRHRYDVRTLSTLTKNEIRPHVFALLNKGAKVIGEFESKAKIQDFYFICLQDHLILNALKRDKELGLLSLLVYIFTHELVHIVRFCNFMKRFEALEIEREKEEQIVHSKTYEILKGLPVPRLDYILDAYKGHRICDICGLDSEKSKFEGGFN
jgi:hypothetical protein